MDTRLSSVVMTMGIRESFVDETNGTNGTNGINLVSVGSVDDAIDITPAFVTGDGELVVCAVESILLSNQTINGIKSIHN